MGTSGSEDQADWRSWSVGHVLDAWEATAALVVITQGPRHVMVYQNAASRRFFGARPLGVPVFEAFGEFSAEAMEHVERAYRHGVTGVTTRGGPRRHGVTGRTVQLTYAFSPARRHGSAPEGVFLVAFDVTAAEDAALLTEISDRMRTASDPDTALQLFTDALVPDLADLAAVYIATDEAGRGGGLRLAPDPAALATMSLPTALTIDPGLRSRAGVPPRGSGPRPGHAPWQAELLAGRATLMEVGPGSGALAVSPIAAWARSAGGHTIAAIPLTLAGELSGVVALLAAGDRQPYTVQDLPFFELAASRAATAVTQMRALHDQRRIAVDLQRALLPEAPAQAAGVQAAVRYVAGSHDVEIGGDWWDVHHLGDGRTAVGVGDVAGHGLEAAAVMGQARAAMRAAGHAKLTPGAVLRLLDAQVADLVDQAAAAGSMTSPLFATSVYAVIDAPAQTLRVANAGHPPLLVRHPHGQVRRVQAPPGPPLGLRMPDYDELDVPFPAGSLLVAFTDGLVESRARDVDTGVDLVSRHLSSLPADHDLEQLVDDLLATMARDEGHADDVALVAIRTSP